MQWGSTFFTNDQIHLFTRNFLTSPDCAPEFRIENVCKIIPFPDAALTSSLFGITCIACKTDRNLQAPAIDAYTTRSSYPVRGVLAPIFQTYTREVSALSSPLPVRYSMVSNIQTLVEEVPISNVSANENPEVAPDNLRDL